MILLESLLLVPYEWVGRVSDKEITQKCGFLDKIRHGDKIMADH